MDINKYRTDKKLEESGTWVPFDDAQFLIARFGNHRFQERFAALKKQYKGKLSETQQQEILIEAMAETIFLSVKNATDQGKPIKDTFENRKAILRVRDISDFIINEAQNFENFKIKQDEEDSGNSNTL